jgi:hypothetical protein
VFPAYRGIRGIVAMKLKTLPAMAINHITQWSSHLKSYSATETAPLVHIDYVTNVAE